MRYKILKYIPISIFYAIFFNFKVYAVNEINNINKINNETSLYSNKNVRESDSADKNHPLTFSTSQKHYLSTSFYNKTNIVAYIGALYNYNDFRLKQDINKYNSLLPANLQDNYIHNYQQTNNAISFVLGAGTILYNRFYIGAEIDLYSRHRTNFNAYHESFFTTTDIAVYNVKSLMDYGLKIGYILNNNIMLYTKGGISMNEIYFSPSEQLISSSIEIVNQYASNARVDKVSSMPYIGGGLEFKLTDHLALRGEYTYSSIKFDRPSRFTDEAYNLEYKTNAAALSIQKFKAGLVIYL